MPVSTYTEYAEVRGVLGVSNIELPDERIEVEIYSFALEEEFLSISPTLLAEYVAIAALDVEGRTPSEQTLYRRARLFSCYAVAYQVTTGLPLFAPKDVGDGKALLSRFSGTPYADVIARVFAEYQRAYSSLSETAGVVTGQFPLFFIAVPLARDPVTSE